MRGNSDGGCLHEHTCVVCQDTFDCAGTDCSSKPVCEDCAAELEDEDNDNNVLTFDEAWPARPGSV